jgi:hypothetical protein
MSVYAVNGKEPAFAWIPSLDTAGNGTTTLNDLIGSRHGTLTNMDAGTDWVSDTGAGGVRALDFDDTNDFATLGAGIVLPGSGGLAISWWEKVATTTGNFRSRFRFFTGSQGWVLFRSNMATYGTIAWGRGAVAACVRSTAATSLAASSGSWVHFALVGTAGADSVTPTDWLLYENGTSKAVDAGNALSGFTADVNQIGFDSLLAGSGCRIDDIRVFSQSLNTSDVSYLYNSGSGRGRVAVSGESRRRRQSVSGGVL